MRAFRLTMVCAALLAASACNSPITPILNTAVGSAPITGKTVIDEKLMYGAEALYNVPAQAYVAADSRGLLPAALKARAKPILQTMRKALLAARDAYRLGDATSFNARVAELKKLKADVDPLIPKTN